MAKVTGVYTGMKGKVGNVVYSMWKGVQVLKTRTIPDNPQSPNQTTNRTLFAKLVSIFQPMLGVIHTYWEPFAGSKSTGWANIMGANQKEMSGDVFDETKLILAKGPLPGVNVDSLTYNSSTGETIFDYSTGGFEGEEDDDDIHLFVYDEEKSSFYSLGSAKRSEGPLESSMPPGLAVANLYGFAFASRSVESVVTSVSNSVYSAISAP